MLTLWIHLRAFFSVVVVSCMHPTNWAQCIRVDQWLIPDIIHAIDIKTGRVVPYQSELDYLDSINDE